MNTFTHTYTPSAGENITTSITNSLKMADRNFNNVQFTFNDIIMNINFSENTNLSYYLGIWERETKKRTDAYRQTPSYKKQILEHRLKAAKSQKEIDTLLTSFNENVSNIELLIFLQKFIPLSDMMDVVIDKENLLKTFDLMGFKSGMWVGFDGEFTDGHKIEWIVGQCIRTIEVCGIINPSIIKFIDELLEKNITS